MSAPPPPARDPARVPAASGKEPPTALPARRKAWTPGRRKAWTYVRGRAPGLGALFAGRAGRRAFWKWWVTDSLADAGDLAFHFGLKLLPSDLCSDFGAALSRRVMFRSRKGRLAAMHANLRRIRPELTEAERDEIVRLNVEAQGRHLVEYSIVHRLAGDPERLAIHNLAQAVAETEGRPVILLGMHIGNWEVGSIAVTPSKKLFTTYVPPTQRARAWIAERIRAAAGMRLVPPGRQGMRETLRLLNEGEGVVFFCDEAFRNEIRGPFFDRPPHLDGNYAAVARLARATGARICPWYVRRRPDGFRFDFHVLPVFDLPPETVRGERLLEDVALLNSVIEPVVRANLDQWYFLDNHLPRPGGDDRRRRGRREDPPCPGA